MSRFLNISKISLFIIISISSLCVILSMNCNRKYIIGSFIMLLYLIIIFINSKAVNRSFAQYAPFESTSHVRNVDYLIIGEMSDNVLKMECIEDSFVQIKAPCRGMKACYELLRHTHSILRDGGNVIICLDSKHINKTFTVFDLVFFHPITINRYNLNRLNRWKMCPFYRMPFTTILYLINYSSNNFKVSNYHYDEIDEFCSERGYSVKYYEK